MCGIAGVIHRGGTTGVGQEMTAMLQSLRHRGPDSTGFAMYGVSAPDYYVMRLKLAEQEDPPRRDLPGKSVDRVARRRRVRETRWNRHEGEDGGQNACDASHGSIQLPIHRGCGQKGVINKEKKGVFHPCQDLQILN